MSEKVATLKAEVEESGTFDDNQEVVGGRGDMKMTTEEPDDLISSDVSTEKVNSGDDEKVLQLQQLKEEERDGEEGEHLKGNSTDFNLTKNTTPGRGGATSRRGGGSRGGTRRSGGGRGGRGRKQGTDSFYNFTSEFHASLFSPTKLNLPSGPFGLSANRPGNEGEGGDNRIPEKIFVTPELITQLSNNINSGFFFINNAMELLKQSQLELYHAKFALEKICRQNDLTQGDLYPQEFASPMEAEQRQSACNVFSVETGPSADNPDQSNGIGQGTLTAESVQVQLDPFQFMNTQSSHHTPMTCNPDFTIGRGGRGRRGARGGGGGPRRARKRREPEEFSSYNSQVSKEGLTKLVKRLDSSLDGKKAKDLKGNRHAVVVLHDIGPVLDKKRNGKSKHFEASKVEAAFEKEMKRVAKLARPIVKTGSSSSSSSASVKSSEEPALSKQPWSGKEEFKLSDGDEVEDIEMEEEEKQVSQKQNLPQTIDVEENEASKVRELVTSNPNNNSNIRSTQPSTSNSTKSVRRVDEDNPFLIKKTSNNTKNENLPRWRQLRVDPEVMERIRKRLADSLQSDTDSYYSSVSNSQQSVSSSTGGKRSKKNSPSSQQSKRLKIGIGPSSSSSSLSSASLSSSSSIASDLTFKSASSTTTKDSFGGITPKTLSDEDMLGLTPNKDNCDCTSSSKKQEEKSGKERGEVFQFSTKVQRVAVNSAFVDNDNSINSEGADPDEEETEDENDDDNNSTNSAYDWDAGGEEDDDDDEDLFTEVRRIVKRHEGELIGT